MLNKQAKWIPPAQRGKVLDFPAEVRKSAKGDFEDVERRAGCR